MSSNDDPNEQGGYGQPGGQQPGGYGPPPPPQGQPYGQGQQGGYGQPGGQQPGGYGPPPPPQGQPYGQGPQYGQPGGYQQGPQYGQPGGYGNAPQYGQPMNAGAVSPSDARMWSMFGHLGALLLWFIAPLVIYLVFKDRDPFIRRHTARSLNFQIVLSIAVVVSWVLTFLLIGFLLLPVIGIAALVFIIMASLAANRGEDYKYPFTPDWVK